ncbi:large conductance mechanosensitive channel protein MscL [Thermotoga profunda]|uniref:large conductance mechanosensitive channel protein MscL n=1 Tax=Thermotoga profunda TaxID=1508420 RepID=UPI00087094F8|nr:large conductance mechanosensitive channel protein MscL [Thermotoga profunda]
MGKMFKEFAAFLKQYNVIGLAVAIIIGGKLNQFVSSLVNDLLMPLIFQPALKAANIESIEQLQYKAIYWGKVISAGIDFLIVAFVVFLIIRAMTKVSEATKKKEGK